MIIAPDMFERCRRSVEVSKRDHQECKNVKDWPSVYTGIAVISNRVTDFHLDSGGYPGALDLLLSSGIHTKCKLEILELGTSMGYDPGTAVALCGSFMQHGVKDWEGDRVCYAHFVKKAVHERHKVGLAEWQTLSMFLKHFTPEYI